MEDLVCICISFVHSRVQTAHLGVGSVIVVSFDPLAKVKLCWNVPSIDTLIELIIVEALMVTSR